MLEMAFMNIWELHQSNGSLLKWWAPGYEFESCLISTCARSMFHPFIYCLMEFLLPWSQPYSFHEWPLNTLRPRQNGCHFPDILKCISLNGNLWIPIKISLKFIPKGTIDNILALVQIMAWHRPGDKSLSELIMVSLPMHICVTRPQWVD